MGQLIPRIGTEIIKVPVIVTQNLDLPLNNLRDAPVTVNLGFPIVDLPGCVEYNRANKKSPILVEDDPNGNVILCDGSVPSYHPLSFEPEQVIPTKAASIPIVPNSESDTENTSDTSASPQLTSLDVNTSNIICPPREALVVGTKIDDGQRIISGYEIQNNRCITLYEEVPIINQVMAALPSTGAVTTTTSIAVVATTSAILAKPLADLLLKVIKPTVKTVIKKVQKFRGKPPKIESRMEKILAQRDRNRALRELRRALKK